MKLETVKSFVLVVLIGASLLLSYTLWSYQPNSDMTLGGEIVDNEMNAGGFSDKTKRSMVKPMDIIFHSPNGYYGFIKATDRDTLYEQMQSWVVTNFSAGGVENYDTSEQGVELIFTDEIPMEIINSLFSFGTDDIVFPSWSMNRIFISFIDESKSLNVEFISSDKNNTATAVINDTASYDQLWTTLTSLDDEILTEYVALNDDSSAIYIPAGKVSLPTYSITPADINPNLFVNILFPNPAVVRETNSQSIGETYFTDSRQMSVYNDRLRMEYVNHGVSTLDEQSFISETELLDRTITHINSHFGWTGDYRLEDINSQSNRVSFQKYYKGYPVFSNSKLSTIQQRWALQQNGLQLIEYDRPLFQFDYEFSGNGVKSLISGESLIDHLENSTDSTLENIQDLKVGYELQYRDEENSEYIQLDPAWYKKENNSWKKVVFDKHSSQKGVE